MKTINPHTLLTDTPKKIDNCGVITELFGIWKKLMNDKCVDDISIFDAFIAGYFLGTNSDLREKYMNLNRDEKFDNRVWNILWKR